MDAPFCCLTREKFVGDAQKFKTGGYRFQLRPIDAGNWHSKAQSVVLGAIDEPARGETKK